MTTIGLPLAKELLKWMRQEGVRHARVGDVELELEPERVAPAPEQVDMSGSEWDPRPKYRDIEDDPELFPDGQVPGFDVVPEEPQGE